MAFIEVVEHHQANGRLRQIYDELLSRRGKLAEVHKVQSLNPESIVAHMELYMTVMFGRSPISRASREMMAVVVSAGNGCVYCQRHHCRALLHYWKDPDRVEALRRNWSEAALAAGEAALCHYAWDLTLNPGQAVDQRFEQRLRDAGFQDRAILDATLVVGYFNFVNRLVMGLGVELEEDPGGYRY